MGQVWCEEEHRRRSRPVDGGHFVSMVQVCIDRLDALYMRVTPAHQLGIHRIFAPEMHMSLRLRCSNWARARYTLHYPKSISSCVAYVGYFLLETLDLGGSVVDFFAHMSAEISHEITYLSPASFLQQSFDVGLGAQFILYLRHEGAQPH